MIGTLTWECNCIVTDLDLNFDNAAVILTLKILSGLYVQKCKVYEVDTC